VKEEQKVAALVTGSKVVSKHLKAIMKAAVNCDGNGDDCFDVTKNPALKREVRAAKKAMVPENYIQRVIQFRPSGLQPTWNSRSTTPIGISEAYLTVAGQNSNNTVRVTRRVPQKPSRPMATGTSTARKDGKVTKTLKAKGSVGDHRLCRLGLGRSGHPFPHHHQ